MVCNPCRYSVILRHSGNLNAALPLTVLALSLLALFRVCAQTDTVDIPSDIPPGIGHLNDTITATVSSGKLSRTVFRLEPHGCYVLTGTITVPAGEHLTVIAPKPGTTQDSAPPQLVWSDTANSPQFSFRCFGNITLKNLWLLYARTDGRKMFVSLQIEDSPDTVNGQVAVFDGVLFDRSGIPTNASGAVGITAKHFRGSFTNCYFRNCVDELFRYYGRAVSFPFNSSGWHADSVTFEQCTFANIGYVYQQESDNTTDFLKFNHCTFFNVVMFPLESGWWKRLAVTNCVFTNTHMFGDVPALRGGAEPYGGTIWIDSVSQFEHAVPFTDQDRRILFANNSYGIEPWLRNWMNENPASTYYRQTGQLSQVPSPQPMMNARTISFFDSTDANGQKVFPLMNRSAYHDSADPGFRIPPSDTARIKSFLYYRWWDAEVTDWAYMPELSLQRIWPLTEDLSYTNPVLVNGGMKGFPIGDLHRWWPEEFACWQLQREVENSRIAQWLESGMDPEVVSIEVVQEDATPSHYELEQNYPNPFNHTTTIRYSIADPQITMLTVYDILGREVSVLVNEREVSGSHAVRFDETGLASGVYLYRLTAGSFVRILKMVLVR